MKDNKNRKKPRALRYPRKPKRGIEMSPKAKRAVLIVSLALLAAGALAVGASAMLRRTSAVSTDDENYVWVLPQKERDRSDDEKDDSSAVPGAQSSGMALDGIMLSESGSSVAIISASGKSYIADIGDEIGSTGWRLAALSVTSATLRSGVTEMTLTLSESAPLN